MTFPFPIGVNLLIPPANTPPDRRDLIDWQNSSTIDGARFINPVTGDYQLASNGHFNGMNAIQQEVYLAVLTRYNTTSIPGFGNNIQSIKIINTPNFAQQAYLIIQQALSNLTSSGQITVTPPVSITQLFPGQAIISFNWIDNVSGLTNTTNLPIKTNS
jgi:hypothetical protein